MYVQQGDVLLTRCGLTGDDLTGSDTVKGDLLFAGDQHHHRLRGDFEITKKGPETFVRSNGCELFHEEHKALTIPAGIYKLSFVQEYSHFDEESRQVVD